MKKIALREHIGDWVYYITSLSFKEVAENVRKIDNELHQSKTLSDMIQRGLTNNVDKIKNYITHQEERFFNALVLAVYDGEPKWREILLDYGDGEKYEVGVLEFNGEEKIFPVDGQHRVEGIKLVVKESSSYDAEMIPVIFIGHKSTTVGMKRTRRLFSTLNRYAKPVTLNDIIALDEDDSIAIATRDVIENLLLFSDKRIRNDKQKAIINTDKIAFTNIITLYECNSVLLNYYISDKKIMGANNRQLKGKSKIDAYCRFRAAEDEICGFINLVNDFWNAVSSQIKEVKNYLSVDMKENPAKEQRSENGGNLLFRPIGQKPFVICAIALFMKYNDWNLVMPKMDKINYEMSKKPWANVAWNTVSKKMISASNGKLLEYIYKFLVDENLLTSAEEKKMVALYKEKQLYDTKTDEEVMAELKSYIIK